MEIEVEVVKSKKVSLTDDQVTEITINKLQEMLGGEDHRVDSELAGKYVTIWLDKAVWVVRPATKLDKAVWAVLRKLRAKT
jgi:hypothetical protein